MELVFGTVGLTTMQWFIDGHLVLYQRVLRHQPDLRPEVRAMRRRWSHDEEEAVGRTSIPAAGDRAAWPDAVPSDLGFAFRVILCRSVPMTIKPLPAPDGIGQKVPTSAAAHSLIRRAGNAVTCACELCSSPYLWVFELHVEKAHSVRGNDLGINLFRKNRRERGGAI